MARILTVREAERLDLAPTRDSRIIRHLLDATSGLPFEVFSLSKRGLRASNVVGLVDVGTVRVEILPKTAGSTQSPQDLSEARQLLVDLLSCAGLLPRYVPMPGRTAGLPRLLEAV